MKHKLIKILKYGIQKLRPSSKHINNDKLISLSKVGAGISLLCAPLAVKYEDDVVNTAYGSFRFLRSLTVGVSISIDYYFSMMGLEENGTNSDVMMSRIHQRAANRILKACLDNGGPYIKLGQGLVAMGHVLPKEYVNTLKVLQDKCLFRESDELVKLFMEDFGRTPKELFKEFHEIPIAAASLAQVYKAVTLNNQEVAVKVQYIDLKKRFNSDFNTVKFLLKVAAIMHPKFNFSWILDDLRETLEQELDFMNEGKNAEKCAQQLSKLKYVYIPKVFWEYCSDRVLVTEFIDAIKISDVDKLKENGFSLADINTKLFETFGQQIFQFGFVHADPHPGNVFIRRLEGKTQLVLIDHGLYQHVPEDERKALGNMWKAVVLRDHSEMKKYSLQLGVEDYEIFAEILAQAPLKKTNFTLKNQLSDEELKMITQFARQRFDMIMSCLQKMPRTLLLVIRNLNIIRAIAYDHGNPIDRYTILARSAISSSYQPKSFFDKIFYFPKYTYYEMIILSTRISNWMKNALTKLLITFGIIPDVTKLIKDRMEVAA